MKDVKLQISNKIAKLQKEYDAKMKIYNKSITEEYRWGDGALYKEAEDVAIRKRLLIDALELIEKFENK